jgi:hypothetical protein
MKGPTSNKTKKPPKKVNHKENMKFSKPTCREKHIKKEDILKGCLA